MTTTSTGGCQCGAVRFEARGTPKFVANCHCTDCRKATGAAFSTWVGWADGQVSWSGLERARHQSSRGVLRGFCSACGTPLTYQGENWAGETHIVIGAFDTPDAFTPAGDVFEADALSWVRRVEIAD